MKAQKKHPTGNVYSQSLKRTADPNYSLLYWFSIILVGVFLFIMPFEKGLFNANNFSFEKPQLSFIMLGAFMLFVFALYLFFNWRLESRHDVYAMLVWFIPLSYLISSFGAASHYYATLLLYVNFTYAVLFTLSYNFSKSSSGSSIFTNGIVLSGYLVIVFGLLNLFGNAHYADAIMVDSNGARLTSVFQYANTYAGFTMAILFSSLFLVVRSKSWVGIIGYSLFLVPTIVSFFLTLSRGGLVLLPLIILFILPFLSLYRQILMLVYLVISLIISLIILNPITSIGGIGSPAIKNLMPSESLKGWAIMITASVTTSIIIYAIHHFITKRFADGLNAKFSRIKFSQFILPIVVLIAGTVGILLLYGNSGLIKLLPNSIEKRIETINLQQHSVLERATFYKDGIKVIKDYPLFGAGGAAWSFLYEKYQNNPYTSRQAHNFFLQYIIEVGIIGFLLFVILLAVVFIKYIAARIKKVQGDRDQHFVFYIIAISLLAHSAIDFDMSFGYIAGMLFLCLGGLLSASYIKVSDEKKVTNQLWSKLYPALLIVPSIIIFVISLQYTKSNTLFNEGMGLLQQQKPLNEVLQPIDKARDISKYHPDYNLMKIQLLSQAYNQTKEEKYSQEAFDLIKQVKPYESYNRGIFDSEYNLLLMKDNKEQALELLKKELNDFPWDISMYERLIVLHAELGNKEKLNGNKLKQDEHWNEAKALYQQVQDKINYLGTLPKGQSQGRPFNVTPNIALSIGQINFLNSNFSNASSVLQLGISNQMDNEGNRVIARWYLASLQKQGKNDQALQDKLFAADPNERQQIQFLLNNR